MPLYAGSGGKALLAFLPEMRQEVFFSQDGLPAADLKNHYDPLILRRELKKDTRPGLCNQHWRMD
jgi:DNA-binding IclR family transcriptional regulator